MTSVSFLRPNSRVPSVDSTASMKILVVASKYLPEYTGASYRIDRLYRALVEQFPSWLVTVICGGVEHSSRADYEIAGLHIRRVRSRTASPSNRIVQLYSEIGDIRESLQYLRSIRCDVIHTIGTGPVVAAAIHHAKRHGIPILIEMVTDGAEPDQGLPLLRRWRRPDLHNGAAIVAISPPLGEFCRRRGYDSNVWIRPNPVDTKKFFPDPLARAQLRAEVTPFGEDDVVIASVAKIMAQKNQIFLLEVLARLPEHFKLVLAGPLVEGGALAARDRAYFAAIQARIQELGLSARVHLVPQFVAAEKYIKAADMVAMPSVQEGLGTPLLEAQACAIPALCNADIPAFAAYVTDGVTGFLRPLDPALWAQAAHATVNLDRSALTYAADKIAAQYAEPEICARYARLLLALASAGPDARIEVAKVLADESNIAAGASAAE